MHDKLSRILIGSILKSIRIEKDIPIKQIASKMNISEAAISQIETGKNSITKENILSYCDICGSEFDFSIDRKEALRTVSKIFELYSKLKEKEFNEAISKIRTNQNYSFSYARFEYYLILYMDEVVNQKNSTMKPIEKIIELGIKILTNEELAIYYDLKGIKYIYLNDSFTALEYLDKSLLYKNDLLMNNYHHCMIYLNLGYYMLAQKFIERSIDIAIEDISFERLSYLILNRGVLCFNTLQNEEAKYIFLSLLDEANSRNNEFLKYCVLSNLALVYLQKQEYENALHYLNVIDDDYWVDFDLWIYKALIYYFKNDYDSLKQCIKQISNRNQVPRYYRSFMQGLKYLINQKIDKSVDCFEICYQEALKMGEVDRATLVLRFLNEFYVELKRDNKLKKVKEIQEKLFQISYANQIIEDIDLNLN